MITGGTLEGRGLNEKKAREFIPMHLLSLDSNHKPHANGSEYAFWERAALVPHTLSCVQDRDPGEAFERKADKDMDRKLRSEASGILAWLMRGCLQWQKDGLKRPDAVVKATTEYREDEDDLALFLEPCCDIALGLKINATDLYTAFSIWWERNIGRKAPGQPWFGTQMSATNRFQRSKVNGISRYKGIDLNVEWTDGLENAKERRNRKKGSYRDGTVQGG